MPGGVWGCSTGALIINIGFWGKAQAGILNQGMNSIYLCKKCAPIYFGIRAAKSGHWLVGTLSLPSHFGYNAVCSWRVGALNSPCRDL